MKKHNLIFALSALALFSCGGGNTNQNGNDNGNGDGNGTDAINSVSTTPESEFAPTEFPDVEPETNIAFEACQKINPLAKDFAKADTAGKLMFSFSTLDEEMDLDRTVSTVCKSHKSGGYVVIYQDKTEGFIGDGYLEEINKFAVYLYNNGTLTERSDLLPKPTMEEYFASDGLAFYDRDLDSYKTSLKSKGYDYELIDKNLTLFFADKDVNPYMVFNWDGEKFFPSKKDRISWMRQIVHTQGLGGIHVGDNPPEQLSNYDSKKSGNKVLFTRNGEKEFELSLNSDGKIDTITILSKLYTYSMCGIGGCNYYGLEFFPVDDAFGMQYSGVEDYFTFKKGTWVRVVEKDGGIIEFATTPNAIKGVKGTEGKVVKPKGGDAYSSDNEVANRDAKVTGIKIYSRGGFCENCCGLTPEQKTDQIRKMYNSVANDNSLTKKHLEIEDPESGYPVEYDLFYRDKKLVMVEASSGDGTMVDKKIYVDDGCPYFCLIETRYPDNTTAFDRIYLCGGIIYKYLDNAKKELPLTSDVLHREQKSIQSLVFTVTQHEKEAK
ncbi:MAG: hypothetical protein J6Z01_00700 [Bacteroidales bacterium]|nr:hypothetical protein [Bacteroidales bacterium]